MADVSFPALNLSSEKFDLDDVEFPSAHADGKVLFECKADYDRYNDDDIEIAGESTKDGYKLSIVTNSETVSPLWGGGGKVEFINIHGQWQMHGYRRIWQDITPIQTSWKFCNPDKVFEIALAGLECAAGESNIDVATLVKSLREQREQIIAQSEHYETEADCNIPSVASEGPDYSGYGLQGWE